MVENVQSAGAAPAVHPNPAGWEMPLGVALGIGIGAAPFVQFALPHIPGMPRGGPMMILSVVLYVGLVLGIAAAKGRRRVMVGFAWGAGGGIAVLVAAFLLILAGMGYN